MLSALVALALAIPFCSTAKPVDANDVDLTQIVDLLASISQIDQKVIDTFIEKKKLSTDKQIVIYGKQMSTTDVIALFKQIGEIDWKTIEALLEKNLISKNKHVNIDGKKVNVQNIVKLAERINQVDWQLFNLSFGKHIITYYDYFESNPYFMYRISPNQLNDSLKSTTGIHSPVVLVIISERTQIRRKDLIIFISLSLSLPLHRWKEISQQE